MYSPFYFNLWVVTERRLHLLLKRPKWVFSSETGWGVLPGGAAKCCWGEGRPEFPRLAWCHRNPIPDKRKIMDGRMNESLFGPNWLHSRGCSWAMVKPCLEMRKWAEIESAIYPVIASCGQEEPHVSADAVAADQEYPERIRKEAMFSPSSFIVLRVKTLHLPTGYSEKKLILSKVFLIHKGIKVSPSHQRSVTRTIKNILW